MVHGGVGGCMGPEPELEAAPGLKETGGTLQKMEGTDRDALKIGPLSLPSLSVMVIVHELGYLVSLCLRFYICKMGLIIAPTSQDCCEASVMHSAGVFAMNAVW